MTYKITNRDAHTLRCMRDYGNVYAPYLRYDIEQMAYKGLVRIRSDIRGVTAFITHRGIAALKAFEG